MKFGFWKIRLPKKIDKKKFLQFPLDIMNGMPCPLVSKIVPSEFQNIMNDIVNPYSSFSIVYI